MAENTRRTVLRQEGQGPQNVAVGVNMIGSGFFETTDILILRGRDISSTDAPKSDPVVIVNETMARRFWPEQNAVGQTVRFFGDMADHRVIGVARDTANAMLGQPTQPSAYLPVYEELAPSLVLNLRTAGRPRTSRAR